MLYSFIFLRLVRTSILKMFNIEQVIDNNIFYHIDDKYEYDHASAQLIKSKEPDYYNSAYKFTIVRNPYDRLVSEYFWKKKDNDIRGVDAKNKTFSEFIKYLYDNFDDIQSRYHKEKTHFMLQSSFILEDVTVFKFENIEDCIRQIAFKFTLAVMHEKHNNTEHDCFQSYYDEKTYNMVYDMYYLDFKLFNYSKF